MEFDLQPNLGNDLVRLRPLRTEDFEELFQVASDAEIWEQHPDKTRHSLEGFTDFFQKSMHSKGALVILDEASEKIIGSSRYKLRSNYTDAVEIGWTFLARKYWGGPYNGQVKRLMMNHAFQYVNQVLFFVDVDNFRSQRAVEKLVLQSPPKLKMDKEVVPNSPDILYIIQKNT